MEEGVPEIGEVEEPNLAPTWLRLCSTISAESRLLGPDCVVKLVPLPEVPP